MVYSGTIRDHFSTLTNLHTLKLENVQIYLFMPHFERYFKPLSPTLGSITLRDQLCTPQQLSHFLFRFPNLDDTEIRRAVTFPPDETAPGTELIPFPAPKMRGRLLLYDISWVETWAHLITSCGGLRFCHVELYKSANCAPLLLEAFAKTLEALRFGARDGSSSKVFPRASIYGLDLTVNKGS